MVLKEFGCGHSLRTGTQVISWIILITCIMGLYGINFYFYDEKKVKITESPVTLLILNCVMGIFASLSGSFGAYRNHRMFLQPFFVYLICQYFLAAIIVWIYYIYIYPNQPSYPRKTRYIILNTILFGTVFYVFLSYAALVVRSFHREISAEITDREFLIPRPTDHHQVLMDEDNFPSSASTVSQDTNRTYLTSKGPNVNDRQRFLSNFSPSIPLPEETHSQLHDDPSDLLGSR